MLQSMLAALVLFIILFLEDAASRSAIIAAIASTAFVVFIMPYRATAQPRKVIGGHFIALFFGGTIAAFDSSGAGQHLLAGLPMLLNLEAAVVVGITIFGMIVTDTEHAPAAGTALGMVMQPFDWGLVLFVVSSILGMVLAHRLLRPWLRNLL